MPSPNEIEILHSIGMDILYGQQDFHKDIVPRIDQVVAAATYDPMMAAKLRRMTVYGPLAQGLCGQAITDINEECPSLQPSSGRGAYDQYLTRTQSLDTKAGYAFAKKIHSRKGILREALEYNAAQLRLLDRIALESPELFQKRGKLAIPRNPDSAATDVLVSPFPANARSTTMALIISEALRIGIHEGELPESAALANELRGKVIGLADGSRLIPQVFSHITMGRESARKQLKQIRKENKADDDFSRWPALFYEYLETKETPPLALVLGQVLLEEPQLAAAAKEPRKHGHCGGQFSCLPDDLICFSEAYPERVAGYFDRQGLELPAGKFRAVDYQLIRGLEVAEQTIFEEPECRLALAALARDIREHTTN